MTEKLISDGPSGEIHLLIKVFDKEEYADAFLNHGEMFCRTVGEFKKLEDGSIRGDFYEGVSSFHQPDRLISLVVTYQDGEGIQHSIDLKKELAGPVRIHRNGFNDLNLFCLYAVKSQKTEGHMGN